VFPIPWNIKKKNNWLNNGGKFEIFKLFFENYFFMKKWQKI